MLHATRTGVHHECVIPGVNGYLFDAGDIEALHCHLRTLLLAGSLVRTGMAAASLTMVKSKFLLDVTMRRIEGVLRTSLANHSSHTMNY